MEFYLVHLKVPRKVRECLRTGDVDWQTFFKNKGELPLSKVGQLQNKVMGKSERVVEARLTEDLGTKPGKNITDVVF